MILSCKFWTQFQKYIRKYYFSKTINHMSFKESYLENI